MPQSTTTHLSPSAAERFPGGCRFAFTVVDDTDWATLANVGPVYELLADLGFRTTKTVWTLGCDVSDRKTGETLQDKPYRDFILHLQEQGFEIGLHGVRDCSSERPVIEHGLAVFHEILGGYPRLHCNHAKNRENLYWGSSRLNDPLLRLVQNLGTRFKNYGVYRGQDPASPCFWGDICKERITYVRDLVFPEVNLDDVDRATPYHDPRKPYVNYWFSGCEGAEVHSFCTRLSEANQDRLEEEGGVCIMYTHLAAAFCSGGELNAEFRRLMTRLASKKGWFVPASTLLDRLRAVRGTDGPAYTIQRSERRRMEWKWVRGKLRTGTS